MENLFNGLKVIKGEIKSELIDQKFNLQISGTIKISKGNLNVEHNYWGDIYKLSYGDNVIGIEGIDYDTQNVSLGDLPIDDLHTLKTKLNESGLRTLSNSLSISHEEIVNAIVSVLPQNKVIKLVYGKNVIIYDTLSNDEKTKLRLDYVINNFDTCGDYNKKSFGVFGDDENGDTDDRIAPTLEQLISFRESLVK